LKGIAFLATAGIFFAVLIAAAFAWDSTRMLDAAWNDVKSAKAEIDRIDERIIRARQELDAATSGDQAIRRRAADEYAGAQNRRAVAQRRYDELVQIYNNASIGLMGRTARRVSSFPVTP